MRNDKLWQDDDVQKALAILQFYQNEEAKVLFTSSGEKYDSVPNHQAVTDLNADAKTLRIGTAWNYCHWVNKAVQIMKSRHYRTEARFIHDWYCDGKRLTAEKEAERLNISRQTLYDNKPKALLRFATECPTLVLNNLYKYEELHNKR